MALCLVALGANQGDRSQALSRAIELLAMLPNGQLVAQSTWHETPSIGGAANQPLYLNAAVLLETTLPPAAMLAALQRIEKALGRVRHERWGPRTIDLDLLLYDQHVISTPQLVVPHPRMSFRRFVIEPAAEIAAEMKHPVIGWTIGQLRDHLHNAPPYVAIAGPRGSGKTRLASALVDRFGGSLLSDTAEPVMHPSPTGSAGSEFEREIELLDRRRRLLDRQQWSDSERLVVSDFWFAQSLAYASMLLSSSVEQEFRTAWQAANAGVVQPKLLILLRPVPDDPTPANTTTVEFERQLDDLLANLASQPDVGPCLELPSRSEEQTLNEAMAAIQAMT